FKARKRTRNKLQSRHQKVFDINPILNLVDNWGATNELTLIQFQKKALVRLTIVAMWKPGYYLGNLQHREAYLGRI
ncbi:hypothetical protein BCV72DRAFT_328962, partial [Rhizopus microsporus var. microsporus]